MPITTHPLPFGLRDVKITKLQADGISEDGLAVDLPVSQTLSFSETEDYEELRGDDTVAATHGNGPTVDWSLESGGLPFEALEIITGGDVTESGTTPDMVKTFKKLGTDARPYFKIEGQVISDSGGDVWCVIYRCKADGDISGEFSDGAFFVQSLSGRGFPNSAGDLYDFIQHETAEAIPTS